MSEKFHKILSKVNENNKNKKEIIADYREKNSLVISELLSLGLDIRIQELKTADYVVNGVVIERKTFSDFLSSMINRRLLKQLRALSEYEERILIIEGSGEEGLYSDSGQYQIHPNAIRGFLISIILKNKTPILFTKDYKDTAMFISLLAKKKEKEISLRGDKKPLNKKEQMTFILESFPGIGPKTSRKLLEEFRSIKNIINASEDELKKIIGKRADFLKIAHEEY